MRQLSLLLIESDSLERRRLREAFTRAGHTVVAITNREELLESLENKTFDVLLVCGDRGRWLTGMDVSLKMQEDPRHTRVAPVIMSGYSNTEGFVKLIGRAFGEDEVQPNVPPNVIAVPIPLVE